MKDKVAASCGGHSRNGGRKSKTGAKQVIENELVKRTNAYNNDTIIYLDPNYWYLSGGGLISVASMVRKWKKA